MVQFPPEYIQLTRYPGYYWNTKEKRLFSIKSGILKQIKLEKAYKGYIRGYGYVDAEPGYRISVEGQRRKLSQRWLCSSKMPTATQTVPEDNICQQ